MNKFKVSGKTNSKFQIRFFIKNASGKFIQTNIYNCDALLLAESIIQDFRNIRKIISKKGAASSSRYLFGGNFPRYSLEWLACHTVKIITINKDNDEIISEEIITHPYTKKICDGWNK